MSRKKLLLWVLVPVITLGIFSFTNNDRHFEMVKNLDIFASLYAEVNTYYVDEVNPNTLMKTGIDAMLKKLDPYTVYIPEDVIEDFRTNATGEYGGIGIQSNKYGDKHLILNLYQDSPAYSAGLKIGDEILAVDGVSLKHLSDEQAGKLMKGQSGSDITLEILRNNVQTLSFTSKREKITIPSISYSTVLGENVGYLRLSEFTNGAAEDVKNTILQLKEKGAKQLIIDLRDNPGGLLNEAVGICNLFVPKGSKIVDTKGKIEAQSHTYLTKNDPLDLTIDLVVLINEGSASASEIVSGVIQDYDRGVVIGQKSYGKGLVQISRKLTFNSQLKVTTAKYYTPSGRCIQALDYSHRKEDGSVGKMADSLKTEFRTSNNRIVFDGGGVDPDILVEAMSYSSYSKNLSQSHLIFDYATKYYYDNDSIKDPKKYQLSEEEYAAFKKWMASQSFENSSNVEKSLNLLKEAASADKVYHKLIAEIDDISNSVTYIKSNGLETFQTEIIRLLEQEIILRYYFTPGQVEFSLDKDLAIEAALNILSNSDNMRKTLTTNKKVKNHEK